MAVNPDIEPHQITNDPVVNEVVDLIINRHLQGMEKFGKFVDEKPKEES